MNERPHPTPARGPHGLMFHRFTATHAAGGQGAITADQLDRLLQFAGVERILSPQEWLLRLDGGQLTENDLCLTFDDGLSSQREIALPVLARHRLLAFWFVSSCVFTGRPIWSEVYSQASPAFGGMGPMISAFLQRCPANVLSALQSTGYSDFAVRMRRESPFYSDDDLAYRYIRNRILEPSQFEARMNALLRDRGLDPDALAATIFLAEADLRELADAGHVVGLHTWDHPYDVAHLPPDDQRDQYARNLRHVAATTGITPVSMAHPLNSYKPETLVILRDLGIRCGFRANAEPLPGVRVVDRPLELPREDAANLLVAAGAEL